MRLRPSRIQIRGEFSRLRRVPWCWEEPYFCSFHLWQPLRCSQDQVLQHHSRHLQQHRHNSLQQRQSRKRNSFSYESRVNLQARDWIIRQSPTKSQHVPYQWLWLVPAESDRAVKLKAGSALNFRLCLLHKWRPWQTQTWKELYSHTILHGTSLHQGRQERVGCLMLCWHNEEIASIQRVRSQRLGNQLCEPLRVLHQAWALRVSRILLVFWSFHSSCWCRQEKKT